MKLKEVQERELSILKSLHDYCADNHLRYFLAYGTLLGAVRHKGFIPWDNDVDVLMPRPDYEKLLALTKTKKIADDLYVEHYTNDLKYHYMCIRICDKNTKVYVPYIREQPSNLGLWVDIFPIDGFPSNFFVKAVQRFLAFYYWILFKADVYGFKPEGSKTFLHLLLKKLLLTLNPNKNNSHNYAIDNLCQWQSFNKATRFGLVFSEVGRFVVTKDDLEELMLMQFEKYEFYVPKIYDSLLKSWYGDYMKLPKVEDRQTHKIDIEEV